MRLLVVEPDAALAHFLGEFFSQENYEVDICRETAGAVCVTACTPAAVLLDLDLREAEEVGCVNKIRVAHVSAAIVVLSSSSRIEDRVRALDAGADDYLSKPFSVAELSARLRGVLRRAGSESAHILRVGDLALDRVQRTVQRCGKRIRLTVREFALLEFLMRNSGRQLTREMIAEQVWGLALKNKTNVIDVYVNYLRKKVGGAGSAPLIHTVRGVGYEMSSRPEAGLASQSPALAQLADALQEV